MISLTQTHESIIERQAQGVPADTISRWLGLSDQEFRDAERHIMHWRAEQADQAALANIPSQAFSAQIYRVIVDYKRPVLSAEIGMQVGMSSREVSAVCAKLERQGLIESTKRGASRLWTAL